MDPCPWKGDQGQHRREIAQGPPVSVPTWGWLGGAAVGRDDLHADVLGVAAVRRHAVRPGRRAPGIRRGAGAVPAGVGRVWTRPDAAGADRAASFGAMSPINCCVRLCSCAISASLLLLPARCPDPTHHARCAGQPERGTVSTRTGRPHPGCERCAAPTSAGPSGLVRHGVRCVSIDESTPGPLGGLNSSTRALKRVVP